MRYADCRERRLVAGFDLAMGVGQERSGTDWRLDILQPALVRQARLGLARHATMARLALGLTATGKVIPGGRTVPFTDDADRTRHIGALLLQMHRLILGSAAESPRILEEWKALAGGDLGADAFTAGTRAPRMQAGKFTRLAGLFASDTALAARWAGEWKSRWEAMDGRWRSVLRHLRMILMPKRDGSDRSLRRRGGLSLMRLSVIEEFRRKVQVAYHTRQMIDGSRAELPEKFSLRALGKLERMRQNRVRLIASRITGAALGIGPDPKSGGRLVRRFAPCHAVVIENLANYRPDAMQTRRENRGLMAWSSGEIRKRLAEACQISGLHLREIYPAFTSRQCSRTGAGGLRAVEVAVSD